MEIINFIKKKLKKNCCICKENFGEKYIKDKKYCKVRDRCYCTSKYKGAAQVCPADPADFKEFWYFRY